MNQTNEAITSLTGNGGGVTLGTNLDDRPAGRLRWKRAARELHGMELGGELTGEAKGTGAAVSFRPGELEIDDDGSGHLLGSRCAGCGAHFFPVRAACAGCLGTDMETVRFSESGKLYTYTVIRQSTPGFEVPYALGYVDLSEGVRIMGQITGCDPDEIRIGMPVVLALEPFGEDDDGRPLTGYRFHPAGDRAGQTAPDTVGAAR